ncbi:IclR family transcriptional regulator domain-containing protein [Microterricola viridarii]|uniref:Glycerol operon regulatory protein n=1 Tax=Microterricola viridarii TaxID=412690 RepID=A0A1H1N744_9MICO|nr:IclR family transcriptional regulator C-terminal domain-containing protein [Microterricola viridarii]SDR94555.1 transcriptional regulator, IclR family [Microterricola viridarii]
METKPSSDYVQSLARGLAVIGAFDAEHRELTLSDVAARTGLTRATARRFLLTLVDLGYVRADGRGFSLTPKVLELGYSYLSALGLPELLQPFLAELSRELGESTSAAILDGSDIVYVARVQAKRIMSVGITIGTRFPAPTTSMGRVLLAGLGQPALDAVLAAAPPTGITAGTLTDVAAVRRRIDEVRTAGWCLVDQELEVGLRSIAAPIRAADGRVLAAINVSTSVATVSLEQLAGPYKDALLDVAARASAAAGHGAFHAH